MIKTTYSLDVESVRALENMARRWKVSKSEALRRAIKAAAAQRLPAESDALRALDRLQQSLELDVKAAARWQKSARSEREAATHRRERDLT